MIRRGLRSSQIECVRSVNDLCDLQPTILESELDYNNGSPAAVHRLLTRIVATEEVLGLGRAPKLNLTRTRQRLDAADAIGRNLAS